MPRPARRLAGHAAADETCSFSLSRARARGGGVASRCVRERRVAHSIALEGFSGSSYSPTSTLVSASITPDRSRYFLNSSFLASGDCGGAGGGREPVRARRENIRRSVTPQCPQEAGVGPSGS